jgi:Protein of unknown function (DUF3467)
MSAQPPQPVQQVQLNVPPDKIAGYYANVVSVWNTPYDFAIDFCINQPYAAGPGAMAAQVVARVRIPPTLVFDLLQALNQNLGQYEELYGKLKRPGEPEEEDS